MGGQTDNLKIGYPDLTDLVKDGAADIADIANAADSALTTYSNMYGKNVIQNGDFTEFGLRDWFGVTIDRFDKWEEVPVSTPPFSVTQSTDHPSGVGFSLLATVTTATPTPSSIYITQRSFRTDLASFLLGTSAAKPMRVRFWTKSSLVGIYNLVITIGALTCVRQYEILTANTWQLIEFSLPPYTATPSTTTFDVRFYLGASAADSVPPLIPDWGAAGSGRIGVGQVNWAATLGNTFHITDLQIEEDNFSEFEYLDQTYKRRLLDRWSARWQATAANEPFLLGYCVSSTEAYFPLVFKSPLTFAPIANTLALSANGDFHVRHGGTTSTTVTGSGFFLSGRQSIMLDIFVATGFTAGRPAILRSNNADATISWSASY